MAVHGSLPEIRLLAARCRLPETGERIEVAHERVSPDVGGRALRRLGHVVRRRPHKPGTQRLVFRMVAAVGALTAVGIRALPTRIRSHREADADARIAGLEDPS